MYKFLIYFNFFFHDKPKHVKIIVLNIFSFFPFFTIFLERILYLNVIKNIFEFNKKKKSAFLDNLISFFHNFSMDSYISCYKGHMIQICG